MPVESVNWSWSSSGYLANSVILKTTVLIALLPSQQKVGCKDAFVVSQ